MSGSWPLVIATRNEGKTREIRLLLRNQPVVVKNLSDFGPIPAVREDGESFDENAYRKASATARMLGLPCLADDSGLVVDALNGLPGVHSARYGGEGLNDAQRCLRLIEALQGVANRRAAFHCVLSLAVPTGPALTWEARCDGRITHSPRGDNGFGYDPVFFYPPLERTFAELDPDEKARVSHRGKAFREFCSEFAKVMRWIERHMPRASVP